MKEDRRRELTAQMTAIQKQIDLLRGIEKPPSDTDLDRLILSLFDRLDQIEMELSDWDNEQ